MEEQEHPDYVISNSSFHLFLYL